MPESGNDLLKGQSSITLDEKGRIVFPARLRSGLTGTTVIITNGMDKCLWIFSPSEWENFAAKITETTSRFNKGNLLNQRKYTAPAQEMEFDRNGRLSIPQSLREQAGLIRDCVMHRVKLGRLEVIELWDVLEYKTYVGRSETVETLDSVDF
ncbi:MAG: cell division/cell wall cluster transcriptional repressor MraZ [Treponema sp.]|jgi:MraZ protein|nr:cell division/cell wall cluster transcriptional repressor MraZ [Treponema sp.]